MSEYDLIVVGTGGGGLTIASEAKKKGINIAMVEKDRPGVTVPTMAACPPRL